MPDTTFYLYLGLGVTGTLLTVYVLSLFLRFANAHKDEVVLQQLSDENA